MNYLLRRLFATLPVMAVVAVVVFLLIHLSPGDPAALIAGDLATTEDIEKLRAALGLDQPLWRQFALWLGRVLSGDLGTSIFTQVSVTKLLAQRLEPTLSIAVLTMALTVCVAVPLGTLAAHRSGTWTDRLVMVFAVLAFSVPVFLIGYLLIYTLAIRIPLFPVQGYVHLSEGVGAWLNSLALPCINLALVYIALITRMTRATVMEVLQEDYIRTARAKGVYERLVISRHALRNALLPVVTVIGIEFAFLFGGLVVTEQVFNLNGIGKLFVLAVSRGDYTMIQALVLLVSVVFVLVNFVIDMLYAVFDPRIRYR